MQRLDLGSVRTARTYPVEPEELLAAARRAVARLPRWTLDESKEGELRIVCESRFFRFKDDMKVRFTPCNEDALGEAPTASGPSSRASPARACGASARTSATSGNCSGP